MVIKREIATRNDVILLLLDWIRPLKKHYSQGAARLMIGDTSAHYSEGSAYMEGYSRVLWGLGSLFSQKNHTLPPTVNSEIAEWKRLVRCGLVNGTDPEHEEYWHDVGDYDQKMVEMAALVNAILLSPDTLWEPLTAVQTWDSCIFSGTEEAEFACKYLRPALDNAGHTDVKINVWDHNKEIILERAAESFGVEGAQETIDGIAFHWYTGDHFDALAEVRRRYPDKELIFTEGCVEYSRFASDNQVRHAEMYAHDMIGDFNAGMNGFIDWNLILDRQGGPNHVDNYCDAPVMCDVDADTINVKLSYYYIGHFSRFIRPGAKRILVSKYSPDIEATAFANRDGSKVLVLLNRSEKDIAFVLNVDGRNSGKMEIKKHSIMTCCWK